MADSSLAERQIEVVLIIGPTGCGKCDYLNKLLQVESKAASGLINTDKINLRGREKYYYIWNLIIKNVASGRVPILVDNGYFFSSNKLDYFVRVMKKVFGLAVVLHLVYPLLLSPSGKKKEQDINQSTLLSQAMKTVREKYGGATQQQYGLHHYKTQTAAEDIIRKITKENFLLQYKLIEASQITHRYEFDLVSDIQPWPKVDWHPIKRPIESNGIKWHCGIRVIINYKPQFCTRDEQESYMILDHQLEWKKFLFLNTLTWPKEINGNFKRISCKANSKANGKINSNVKGRKSAHNGRGKVNGKTDHKMQGELILVADRTEANLIEMYVPIFQDYPPSENIKAVRALRQGKKQFMLNTAWSRNKADRTLKQFECESTCSLTIKLQDIYCAPLIN